MSNKDDFFKAVEQFCDCMSELSSLLDEFEADCIFCPDNCNGERCATCCQYGSSCDGCTKKMDGDEE